ncbi:MAG: DUF927 domain-containing protein [Hyphomicrobiaceae bacterium]|nr:DUF927 domain-containing protein [Hyphomicrobiaceae bacterium]
MSSNDKDRTNAYVSRIIEDELAAVREAGRGGRNPQLNKSAYAIGQILVAGDQLESEVFQRLMEAARDCGLETNEAKQTIESGLSAGMNSPRDFSDIDLPPTPRSENTSKKLDEKQKSKRLYAKKLRQQSAPVPGTEAETYLKSRGIADISYDGIGFLARHKHTESGKYLPTILYDVTISPVGELLTLHRGYLKEDGSGKAEYKPNKKALGSFRGGGIWFGKPAKKLVVVEGPEDAMSCLVAGYFAVSAVSSSNMANLTIGDDVEHIIIGADHGEAGEKAAKNAVHRYLLSGLDVSIVFPPKGHDWNSLLQAKGIEAVQKALETGKTFSDLPEGFQRNKGFVEYRDGEDKDDNPTWKRLCSPLKIIASTRDSEDKNHGLLLRIKTREGRHHEWSLPMEMLAGSGEEYRRQLLSLGLRLTSGSKAHRKLNELLSRSTPFEKALNVDRIGWHGPTFVLPDTVFGEKSGERVVYQSGTVLRHAFRTRGTLDGWRVNIARLAIGNSRLIIAISIAFAAPLLRIVGMESGGLHERGGSSSGKTTLLIVAGSVCGGGGVKGYITSWRATDNGLESVAVSHSDNLLCLDELAQVSPDAAAESVYMLGNEQGKQRLDRSGHARPVAEWRLLYLSSGEISLADKIAQSRRKNVKIMAGQQVRFIDMKADAGAGMGVFEDCHECDTDSRKFADLLKENASLYYGTAMRAFLEKLTEQDFDELREKICTMQKRFVKSVADGMDGQIQRVAQRFSLIAAGGELATEWGITGWPKGKALAAAKRCFSDWLKERGSNGPSELIEGLAHVRSFIEANGSSRFTPWEELGRPTINRCGYVRSGVDGPIYLIFPNAWRNTVCKGFDHKMIANALLERGILETDNDGRLQKKVRLPDMNKPTRFYALNHRIIEGCADEQR